MSRLKQVEYSEASGLVRAVYDDIISRCNVDDVDDFWKRLANDPELLQRTWDTQKTILAPDALDMRTKVMIFLAVSVTNGSSGIACHTALARKVGMTDAMFRELMVVVGIASEMKQATDRFYSDLSPCELDPAI